LDYFTAVQTGRSRVRRSLERLQEVAGPSYPLLFLKMGEKEWTPVGEEELITIIHGKGAAAAVVLCDSDGNAKAMSSWSSQPDAERVFGTLLSKGLAKYQGEVKLPV